MTPLGFALAVLALAAAANAGVLDNCDDCFSPGQGLVYGSIYFGGSQYGAYAVCSNGYIVLLPSAGSSISGYSYNPQPINTLYGSPIIAPYWSDNNLNCGGSDNSANKVIYEESCDTGLLTVAKNLAQDADFDPTFVVVVEYDRVIGYTCPAGENTYSVLVSTDMPRCKTYVTFLYQTMEWSQATSWMNSPTVGYGNGQCQGFQLEFSGVNPSPTCGSLTYQVDGPFTQQVQAQNKGNVAQQHYSQQVIMQEFAQKSGEGGMQGEGGNKAAMQEQLHKALETAQMKNQVLIQDFGHKK